MRKHRTPDWGATPRVESMPTMPSKKPSRARHIDPTAPQAERTRVSTPWAVGGGMVSRAPQARQDSPPEGRAAQDRARARKWWGLPRRDMRKPLQLTIKLRGGTEGWVEIHARGRVGRYPGYVTILDVLTDINSQR